VSPDGRRLAFINGTRLHVRNLGTGEERIFDDVLGELGGHATSWAGDSRSLAFEMEGADVSSVAMIDTATGEMVRPQPEGEDAVNYWAYSPQYRPSDGLLGVVCCGSGDRAPHDPPPGGTFVLHDPATGRERERFALPFGADQADYDSSGLHQLFTTGGEVHRHYGGEFTRVPRTTGIRLVAW
jgi:hypothetical protein